MPRIPPAAAAALGCALALAACARAGVERAAPARTSTEQALPEGTAIAPPGTAPSATIVR